MERIKWISTMLIATMTILSILLCPLANSTVSYADSASNDEGQLTGDINGDGDVDILDFIELKLVLLGAKPSNGHSDFDGNGVLNNNDFNALLGSFFSPSSSSNRGGGGSGGGGGSSGGGEGGSRRAFTATISPSTSDPEQNQDYTITFTADPENNKKIGSVSADIPSGFTDVTISSVAASSGFSWSGTIASDMIRLESSNGGEELAAGEYVSVVFSATAPSSVGTYEWTAKGYEGRGWGGDIYTLLGEQPAVTVSSAPTATPTPTPTATPTPTPTPTSSPEWVYETTYSGQPTSYWKYTWLLQETLPSGTGDQQTYGGTCDKYEINTYSDAACTTPVTPKRTASSNGISTSINILSPGYDWRNVDNRMIMKRYFSANTIVGYVTAWVYDRLHAPDTFGAPFTLGESWTYTEQLDCSISAGDKTTYGITAVVADATEEVTVPAGTFTCYKVTITQGENTIIEYWDAGSVFPYAPVKIIDSVNFDSTQTSELYSSTSTPTPTPTSTPIPTPSSTPTPTPTPTTTPTATPTPTPTATPTPTPTPTSSPEWVYETTYSGQPTSYWKYTWLLQETLPSGTGDQQTYGGTCDKYEQRIYFDAACTTTMSPTRSVQGNIITIQSPGYDWRHQVYRLFMKRYNVAKAMGGLFTVTNDLYYRLYTPEPFGAPFVLGDSWTYTEQVVPSLAIGSGTYSYSASVASATQQVTVPAGTFTCYVLTLTRSDLSGKSIIEYWDASGIFPYAPVKIVDSVNFDSTQTSELYSYTGLP